MKRFIWVVLAFSVLGFACRASAQSSDIAQFTASPDHNAIADQQPVVDHYELLVFAPGSTTALPVINLLKPRPDAQNVIRVDVTAQMNALPASPNCNPAAPTAAQCYTMQVRVVGPGGSNTGPLSDPFTLGPSAPGTVAIRKDQRE